MQMMDRALGRVEEKVEELDERMNKIEAKLDSIIEILKSMNKDTESMGKHVEFVESVYDQVKRPFHFLMGSVDSLSKMRLVKSEEEPVTLQARHLSLGAPVDL